jgi:hypothetical protein
MSTAGWCVYARPERQMMSRRRHKLMQSACRVLEQIHPGGTPHSSTRTALVFDPLDTSGFAGARLRSLRIRSDETRAEQRNLRTAT